MAVTVPVSALASQPRSGVMTPAIDDNQNEHQQDSEQRIVSMIPKNREGVHVVSFPIVPVGSEYGDIEDGDRISIPHGNIDHALDSMIPPAGEMFKQASMVTGSKPSTPIANVAGSTTSIPTIAPTSNTTTQPITGNTKMSLSEAMQFKIDSTFVTILTSRNVTAEDLNNNADLRLDNVAIDFQLLLASRQVMIIICS